MTVPSLFSRATIDSGNGGYKAICSQNLEDGQVSIPFPVVHDGKEYHRCSDGQEEVRYVRLLFHECVPAARSCHPQANLDQEEDSETHFCSVDPPQFLRCTVVSPKAHDDKVQKHEESSYVRERRVVHKPDDVLSGGRLDLSDLVLKLPSFSSVQ